MPDRDDAVRVVAADRVAQPGAGPVVVGVDGTPPASKVKFGSRCPPVHGAIAASTERPCSSTPGIDRDPDDEQRVRGLAGAEGAVVLARPRGGAAQLADLDQDLRRARSGAGQPRAARRPPPPGSR